MGHRPPELTAIAAALMGVGFIVGGIHRLRQRLRERKQAPDCLGMVSSVRVVEDAYVATIRYETATGEEGRVEWTPYTQPSLGQTVALRFDPKAREQVIVADAGDSWTGPIAVICLGVALVGLSLFLWINLASLTRR